MDYIFLDESGDLGFNFKKNKTPCVIYEQPSGSPRTRIYLLSI